MVDVNWTSNDNNAGYSTAEAARLLNMSPSTVARRLKDGDLEASGRRGGRKRVSATSVHALRSELAATLEMHIDGDCVERARYDALLQQNLDLQAVVDDLRTAIASLNDALGRATPRRVPTDR